MIPLFSSDRSAGAAYGRWKIKEQVPPIVPDATIAGCPVTKTVP
ncbi:hypothetical protein FP2506_00240 [Fulvimarina pelagi HTCC2506]|uniref:Uncharacterized protein n=1 Tax=Fulvimarina pelagi HTCC2506 TaxID=314231 RepID=Q0FXT7_9HYPH|nr:hypothetical protein FP2506_00240 [Fulvimarina pelagi HTCC2506]